MSNFGETLRRERELRDISLREIADATKINLRYLEALEQNRFDILPGGVFNKGFIRAYARFIGANGEAFVDSYMQEISAREAQTSGAMGGMAHRAPEVPPGLLRPAEAPKRRARLPAESAAPPLSLAQPPAGEAAAPMPAEIATPVSQAVLSERERDHQMMLALASRASPRRRGVPAYVLVLALAGTTGAVLIGLMLVSGLRREAAGQAAAQPVSTGATGDTAAPAGPAPSAPPDTAAAAAAGPSDGSIAASPIAPGPVADPAAAAGASQVPPAGQTSAKVPSTAPPNPIVGSRESVRPPSPQRVAGAWARPATTTAAVEDPRSRPAQPNPSAAAPPPAPPASGVASTTAPAAAPRGPMQFRVEATAPVWVNVACDGDDQINRTMQAGETTTVRCLSLVRVSVTDAGAVRLLVNGARCDSPGEPGARMVGFMIRAEDAAAICPPRAGAAHGRR